MIERLCRLAWNNKNWEEPIGHKWKKDWQGRKDKSYEQQHGYGHEEWLFNPLFNKDEKQYGFIQGIAHYTGSKIDRLHLFTIEDETVTRYYLGYLENVEVISDNFPRVDKIDNWIGTHIEQMESDLRKIYADYSHLQKFGYRPNIRFTLADAKLLPKPNVINSEKFRRSYFRYQPFKFNQTIEEILFEDIRILNSDFDFRSCGPGNKVAYYEKNGTSSPNAVIEKFHNRIELCLFEYLKNISKVNLKNISCGGTRVGNNIVDIATKTASDSFEFYEIKSSGSARTNIRNAIGQLLDYAYWTKQGIKKLIIVSPIHLDPN